MRTAGILMPVSSLPSEHGIGGLGKEARRFIDFLSECRQKYWQILPMGPTGYGNSPYQSFSAFAGSPYYIDPFMLAEDGYVTQQDILEAGFSVNKEKIDYNELYIKTTPFLEKACRNIEMTDVIFEEYVKDNKFWIEDYALFMALKEENDMKPFWEWDKDLREKNDEVIKVFKVKLDGRIMFWKKVQFLFHQQWMKIKGYASHKNIEIIGDMPIYVSEDSCDLWMHPELFQCDETGRTAFAAGCPPDEFSPEGQLWGNPVYAWENHKNDGFGWWIKRLEHWSCFYDVIRIDHFRGFSGYYSVPRGNINAVEGEWKEGPGKALIAEIKDKLPRLRIIAEDLGTVTEESVQLLGFSGFPGMKVLQFAFSSDQHNPHLPHNYEKPCVVYTGTHDNETIEEWVQTASKHVIENASDYLSAVSKHELREKMIRTALGSVADIAIIPLQDWLGTGRESRINTPSTADGNWVWRVSPEVFTEELKRKIKRLTELYGRA